MTRDVIMEEEKRMMDAKPPFCHVTRQLQKGSRSHFININLSPCQHILIKHSCVFISGGWLHLCLLMTMNASMFNPTWRRGRRFFAMCLFGLLPGNGKFCSSFFPFFFLLQAVINTENQSHEISHWLQSGPNVFLNLLSS